MAHYDAMLKLLQLSGPEVYQSPALLKSFSGIRGIAVGFLEDPHLCRFSF
jgi:hypothetical protein